MLFVAGRQADRIQARAGARYRPAGRRRGGRGRPLMNARHLFRALRLPAAVAALALMAAGCTVGPNYERPKLEPPAQHRDAAPAPHAGVGGRPATWWQVFQDPALQALIREGVANNLDLRIASARVVESRALAGIAKSYLYPEIGAGFGTSQEQRSRVGDPEAEQGAGSRPHLQQLGAERLALVGDRSLRPPPPRAGSRLRPVPRDGGGPAGRARHARGRHRVDLLLPARARPLSSRSPGGPSSSTTTRWTTTRSGSRAASPTAWKSTRPRRTGP